MKEDYASYIKKLPKAFDESTQNALLTKYAETKDENVRQLLIEHNLRLVASIAGKYINHSRIEIEDLMQEGTLELMRVVDSYDPSLGFSFSTYAINCIQGKIISTLNRKGRSKDAMWRNWVSEVYTEDSKDPKFEDVFDYLPYNDDFIDEYSFKDLIKNFESRLNETEKYVFTYRYLKSGEQKKTIRQIAEELKLGKTVIDRLDGVVRDKFRAYYINGGWAEDKEISKVQEYIKNTSRDDYKILLEHFYGLNGKEKLSCTEIAKLLGWSIGLVGKTHKKIMREVFFETDLDSITVEDVKQLLFESRNATEEMIFEHLYGLNGKEQLKQIEIAEKYGLSRNTVSKIIERGRKKILDRKVCEKYDESSVFLTKEDVINYIKNEPKEINRSLIENFYGLNGNKKHSNSELSEMFGLSYDATSVQILRIKRRIKEMKQNQEFME